MSLYPSNIFKNFAYPTPMQSIFEDFNDLFSESLFQPFYELEGNLRPKRHRAPHHRYFSTAVKMTDYRADEIAVKVEDRKVRIKAKHQDGEDMCEMSKTVNLPEDVDAEKVETRLTKEGFLIVRAPYAKQEKPTEQTALNEFNSQPWEELRQLLRGPGITDLREHFVKDEKTGETKFHVPVPVRDFHPDEISVKHIGDKVVVRAEHKEERDGQLVHRCMNREFTLPQGVDKDHLVSRLNENGVLVVEAPAPNLTLPEAKDIPVETMEVEQQQQQQQEEQK
jgi:HSP20 family molecular chaperone IbpA